MSLKQIFTIQKLFISFEIFSFSMVLPFLIKYFSFKEVLGGYLILYLTPLPLIYFSKKLFTKELLFSSFIIRWLCVFIFVLKPTLHSMYAYFFFNGLIIFFFWTPYNIRYFTFSHRMNRATSAGHFVIVGPILNTFIPFISGLIISRLGPKYIISISTILMLFLLYKGSKLPKLNISYSFADIMKKSDGLRLLKFIQGIWEVASMLTPLYALIFLTGELAYGGFLSYLGLVGVIATLFITKFSDIQQKRLKFFLPLVISLGLITLALSFMDTLIFFAITAGLLGIIRTLTYPFFFAVLLDKIEDKAVGMIVREFMLNAGRVIGVGVFLISIFFTGSMKLGFFILGITLLIYPVILISRKFYVEEAYNPLLPVAIVYHKGKLAAKVYAHGGVKIIKDIPHNSKEVIVKTFNGTKWATKIVGNKSYNKLRKTFSGDIWILRKVRKIMFK